MKKLIFKVSAQKDMKVSELIKSINRISCRIFLDLANGIVSVENVSDSIIDNVIELVNNNYTILGVDIDNTDENDSAKTNQKDQITGEPQQKEDLLIERIKFKDEDVEEEINKLMRSAYWAIYKKGVSPDKIVKGIRTLMTEFHMEFSDSEVPDIVVGDIVECNYGYHLTGEVNGGHVGGIVCNIDKDRVFVIPTVREVKDAFYSQMYVDCSSSDDITYYNDTFSGGMAVLNVAKYIRIERVNSVIGHAKPEFLEKIIKMLPSAFDFSTKSKEDENKNKPEGSSSKMGIEEMAFYEEFGYAFDKLDKSKPINEQIKMFISDIGMDIFSNVLVSQAFESAFKIDKINYNNVVCELKTLNPSMIEEDIKDSLQKIFKKWIEKYPKITKRCKRISIISLIQAFAKKFK